jgi:hypothetical protein
MVCWGYAHNGRRSCAAGVFAWLSSAARLPVVALGAASFPGLLAVAVTLEHGVSRKLDGLGLFAFPDECSELAAKFVDLARNGCW